MKKRLVSVKNLPSLYPEADITQGSIRWWIYKKDTNGFDHCMARAGRKILIDLDRFETWLFQDK